MPTMSYAALMVYFDDVPDARQRARLAAGLAGRFNAALIGVAGRVYLRASLPTLIVWLREKTMSNGAR